MNTNTNASSDYEEGLIETLKDEDEAYFYLKTALEEKDAGIFLLSLGHVLKARGDNTCIDFSEDAVQGLQNIFNILDAVGINFSIERNKDGHSHA